MPWWIIENTLMAAILALIVVLVSRTARLAPVIRHGLWLVVFIKLITPPMFSVDLPISNPWRESARLDRHVGHSGQSPENAEFPQQNRESPGFDRPAELGSAEHLPIPIDAISFPVSLGDLDTAQVAEPTTVTDTVESTFDAPGQEIVADNPSDSSPPARESVPATAAHNQFIAGIVAWLFVAGTCLMTALQSLRIFRLRRMLGRSVAAPGKFTALVSDVAARMRRHSPEVRFSNDVNSPIVCALGRAVLIWPSSGLPSLNEGARQAVIVHELAHLARRDHWIGWLALTASCGWWWNPVFWYVRRQLHDNAELACDAWAAALFPKGKRDYARALVDLAELDSLQMATVPALGVGDGSRKLFERRLVMILGERVRYRMGLLGMIGTALLGLVALPGCEASLAGDESAPREPAIEILSTIADPPAEATPLPVSAEPAIGQQPSPLGPLPIAIDQAFPVNEAPQPSNEDRLKRLEDKFDALLTELRGLKASSAQDPANRQNGFSRNGSGAPQAAGTSADAQKFTATKPTMSNRQRTATRTASFPPGTTVMEDPDGTTVESAWPVPDKHATKATVEYKTDAAKSPAAADGPRAGATAPQNKYAVDANYKHRTVYTPMGMLPVGSESEAVPLTRVTYKLPAHRAAEFAEFLKANLSDDIEVRVKDDALQVTAPSGDQGAISQFIRLLQTRGAAEAKTSPKVNGPKGDLRARPKTESFNSDDN